jgi:thiamine biosynthesis lipoprotein
MAVLAAARGVSEASGGAFDVSVAPLVDAWGFGVEKRREVPPPSVLAARRASVDYRGFRLDARAGTVTKAAAGVQADLGGIAKGFAVDLAARALDAQGIGHYMVEAGGEVRTRGVNADGQPWRIGVEQPDAMPQRARLVLPLSGRAMATSGDYRNYFEIDGRRYSHEIDPRTGAPIDHRLCSVTVVAEDCMRADALATALLVLGPDRGVRMAESLGLAAYFIERVAPGQYRDHPTGAFAALGGRPA